MEKDTGGYAFPIPNADLQTFQPATVDEYKRIQSGMTLRDYFAAKAMCSFIHMDEFDRQNETLMAERSYDVADAMLRARGQ